jgi:hypothetical protein
MSQNVTLNVNKRPVEVYLLVVFVERLHLLQNLVSYLVERRHLVGRDRYFNVVESSDDRLELRVVNTVKRFYNLQVLFVLFVLFYG